MTIGSTQDRRQFIQDKLAAMAEQTGSDRLAALREIAVNVLSFSPVNDSPVKTGTNHLPDTGTVIGKLTNDYGPDYTAMHFDLSTGTKSGRVNPRVTLPQIQEANSVVQRYALEETNPLLIFTLPHDSGLQFVTGNLSPSNPNRLDDILRVSTYWDNLNRTALACLDRIGDAIARGEWPEQAFKLGLSVQPVTQEFFKDYKASYDRTVATIAEAMGKAEAEQFTQTLFNRLLFIHFISKKGWTTWHGNTDYLKALWTDYQNKSEQTNFHSDRLTILFHEGMNTPEDQRDATTEKVIGQVPFLNGGLFDRNELDLKGIHVDDELISGIVGREGLFSQYNFTVTEATPLDTEVAVDPEMLGKLFEETVNERHDSGAYYTPRPVVTFMCREALKEFIACKDIAGLDREKIAELVDGRTPEIITLQQALDLANSVAGVKVVDPACGSGAFLLGMLQEILNLNDTLFRAGKTPESLYQQKLDIITNNIYGADNDALAVSTAMLRLWLSLAVDYEGEGIPNPLPNLDMKLAVGDSIAGPNPRQLDFTGQTIYKSDLRENIAEYTTAQGQRKSELRQRIGETKQQLRDQMGDAAPAGVVEWRIEFTDVMLNEGFDVVIANPPYVQLQANGGELGNLYKSTGFETFARAGDIYQLFYERGCQLAHKERGILAYITSNSWLKAEYGKPLRRYFSEKNTPLLLMELGKDVFESAIVDSSVLVLRAGGVSQPFRAVDMDRVKSAEVPPPNELWGQVHPDGDAPWSVMSLTGHGILDKMRAKGTPLKEWDVSIYRGATTGYNNAFIVDSKTREALVSADPKSAEIIKPVLRGKDIQRFRSRWAGQWLITIFPARQLDIEDFPAIKRHLLNFGKEKLEQSGRVLPDGSKARKKTSHSWFELQDATAYHKEFSKEKLIWMDLTEQGRFAFDDGSVFCMDTTFMMIGKPVKYLCAVLNSTLATWFMRNTALTSGMGVTRWKRFTVERIPIPKLSAEERRPFIQLVDRILAAKSTDPGVDTRELEKQIDALVYGLYGLTNEEIRTVDENPILS